MYKCYKNTYAFTLVELIVVITILAVLSTIAFISFQGYTMSARDSVRLADMSNISKGFSIKVTKAEKLPIPDNKVNITASGTILNYQGDAGVSILGNIGISGGGVDPVDKSFYTYSTNTRRNKFQLLGFFENEDNISFTQNTFANLSKRFPKVKGDELGILLHPASQEPIQGSGSNVDIVNTVEEYDVVLDNSQEGNFTGTGNVLFSKTNNLRKDLLEDSSLVKFDKSLMLYLDMETTISDDGLIKLKDLSSYERMGICKNNHVDVDCGINGQGPQVINNQMFFDGIDDYVYFDTNNNFNNIIGNNDFTILLRINSGGNRVSSIIGQRYGDNTNLFQHVDGTISLNMDDTRYGSVKSINPVAGEHFITTTFDYDGDNSQTHIYIDGVKSNDNGNSWDGNGVQGNIGDLYIGWQSRLDEIHYPGYYYGFLDDIRIYNRVLSHNEINSIYESSK